MTNSQVSSGDIITAAKLNEFTVGTSAPSGPLNIHSLWLDTSSAVPVLKRWTGSIWSPLQLSGTTPLLVASAAEVSFAQDSSYNTVINTNLSPSVSTTQYGLVAALTIRQTNTLTAQTAWRYSIRLNASASYQMADQTVNSQQPGNLTVVARVHRMPPTSVSSGRIGSFFEGIFVPDNATVGSSTSGVQSSVVMSYLNGNWTSITVGIHAGIGGNQAFFYVGPLYVWRVGA